MGRLIPLAALTAALVTCGDRARAVQGEAALRELVQQRVAAVERATGLKFKRPPVVARRTRRQIVDYIAHKLDEDQPADELEGFTAAGRLFGFFPETLDLRAQLLAVLGEQVAGYYDPDSATLYVAADVDSFYLRTAIAHELVHALQDQYLRLDSIVRQRRQNDRRGAAQAVLEGQATLVQTLVMMPELKLADLPSFSDMRGVVNAQQGQMPAYASAPLWLREVLVFPYLAGADFVRWYLAAHGGELPYGRMPVSTEQVLHPERYRARDEPTDLSFVTDPSQTVRYEDGLGEFEIRVLLQELLADSSGLRAAALAAGWDGDRYQVIRAGSSDALVWYSVWDDDAAARRFVNSLERAWPRRRTIDPTSRRTLIEAVALDGRPAVRLIDAPPDWTGWDSVPSARLK